MQVSHFLQKLHLLLDLSYQFLNPVNLIHKFQPFDHTAAAGDFLLETLKQLVLIFHGRGFSIDSPHERVLPIVARDSVRRTRMRTSTNVMRAAILRRRSISRVV